MSDIWQHVATRTQSGVDDTLVTVARARDAGASDALKESGKTAPRSSLR